MKGGTRHKPRRFTYKQWQALWMIALGQAKVEVRHTKTATGIHYTNLCVRAPDGTDITSRVARLKGQGLVKYTDPHPIFMTDHTIELTDKGRERLDISFVTGGHKPTTE